MPRSDRVSKVAAERAAALLLGNYWVCPVHGVVSGDEVGRNPLFVSDAMLDLSPYRYCYLPSRSRAGGGARRCLSRCERGAR